MVDTSNLGSWNGHWKEESFRTPQGMAKNHTTRAPMLESWNSYWSEGVVEFSSKGAAKKPIQIWQSGTLPSHPAARDLKVAVSGSDYVFQLTNRPTGSGCHQKSGSSAIVSPGSTISQLRWPFGIAHAAVRPKWTGLLYCGRSSAYFCAIFDKHVVFWKGWATNTPSGN